MFIIIIIIFYYYYIIYIIIIIIIIIAVIIVVLDNSGQLFLRIMNQFQWHNEAYRPIWSFMYT